MGECICGVGDGIDTEGDDDDVHIPESECIKLVSVEEEFDDALLRLLLHEAVNGMRPLLAATVREFLPPIIAGPTFVVNILLLGLLRLSATVGVGLLLMLLCAVDNN